MKGADHVPSLRASGYSHWCSMCRHMWLAVDAGRQSCGKDCGGPISGRSFPEYDGPLSGVLKSGPCFVCGEASTHRVECADGGVLGVCSDHLHMLAFEVKK